jgi:methionyl-tRNA formyltransferase
MTATGLRPRAQRPTIGAAPPQPCGARERPPPGPGLEPDDLADPRGASRIPITLFEATAALDAGPIYLQQEIELQVHELVEEWRALQAQATVELCLAWFDRYREVVAAAQPQHGEASHYRRRRPADSQLDPERSLAEQFILLRVVDNQRYPAFSTGAVGATCCRHGRSH